MYFVIKRLLVQKWGIPGLLLGIFLLYSCPGGKQNDYFDEKENIPVKVIIVPDPKTTYRIAQPYYFSAVAEGLQSGFSLKWKVEKITPKNSIPLGMDSQDQTLVAAFPLPGMYKITLQLLQATNVVSQDERIIRVFEKLYSGDQQFYDPLQIELMPYQDKEKGKKWGYYDPRKQQVIITPRFDDARKFTEGLGAVRIGDKWGYIDASGNLTIGVDFEMAMEFSEERAAIALKDNDGKWIWGFIDKQGRLIVEPTYTTVFPFENGLARVGTDSDGDGFADSMSTVNRDGVIQANN